MLTLLTIVAYAFSEDHLFKKYFWNNKEIGLNKSFSRVESIEL